MYIFIENTFRRVTKDFCCWEYFYPDYPDALRKSFKPFYLNESLVLAPQIIRNFINVPVNITSVHRPVINQLFHYYFMAVDLQINRNKEIALHNLVIDSLKLKPHSDLFINLRKCGINGFGCSGTHLHLDIRTGYFNNHDDFGPFCEFDET